MKLIPIALLAAMLAACNTVPPAPPAGDPETAKVLSEALSRVEALPAGTANADVQLKKPQMNGPSISINYAGDAKDLLRQVSASRGKKFSVRGAQPHLPLFVIVDVKGASFEEFLTDVGSQFGQRADLVLTNDSIEVRYRGQ